jgi:hypothetical protein
VDEEITTELTISQDDEYNSEKPRVIVMSNSFDADENFSTNPENSTIVVVNVDSSNKYIKTNGDTSTLRSVYVFDKQRMDDLDIKLKKFNFEWHEEQLYELQEKLEEIQEDQEQFQEEFKEAQKLYKIYSDTIFTKNIQLDSNYRDIIDQFDKNEAKQFRTFKYYMDSNNVQFKMPQFELDSLTNYNIELRIPQFDFNLDSLQIPPFFYSDSLLKNHFEIDIEQLQGMDKHYDNCQLVYIKKINNLERDINNYIRVNKMIPIEVPIEEDGDDFSFILWFDPTPELLQKLPSRVSDMLEFELDALQNTSDVCQTPIKGEEAILDIWRSCSGAIENLHVFPNPTTGEANLQFNLNEPRDIKITLNDLYGRNIRSLSGFYKQDAGLIKQDIDLSDLPAGMYLVAVETKSGEQAVQRIIVE